MRKESKSRFSLHSQCVNTCRTKLTKAYHEKCATWCEGEGKEKSSVTFDATQRNKKLKSCELRHKTSVPMQI